MDSMTGFIGLAGVAIFMFSSGALIGLWFDDLRAARFGFLCAAGFLAAVFLLLGD